MAAAQAGDHLELRALGVMQAEKKLQPLLCPQDTYDTRLNPSLGIIG